VTTLMKMLFPLVTADVALFTLIDQRLRVLLVQRAESPSIGDWALPGGILRPDEDESLEETARRALITKTQVKVRQFEQVATFSGANRDPRGWSVSTLYYALLPSDQVPAVAGDRTEAILWANPEDPACTLAFDHAVLLEKALKQLRSKVERGALPLHLMAEKFILTDVQRACEAIAGRSYDKGAFRRQIKNNLALVAVDGEFFGGAQRPAQIYRTAPDFFF
jgi:8-oxo-dGTP diphosphatase